MKKEKKPKRGRKKKKHTNREPGLGRKKKARKKTLPVEGPEEDGGGGKEGVSGGQSPNAQFLSKRRAR